ncbi:MAG: branched-chain amino acid transaminase [Bacteroidetes bacterium]|jgi:branched-chain amino acid aminotransferase|nr:branched-chain amino acid transaminase [Bacteroidota bacterium]
MPIKSTEFIWMNGALVKWNDANVHILTHALHYGSSWFEGIRCYPTKRGPAVFRLDDHLRRIVDSAKIYRAQVPYSVDQLTSAVLETIRANKLASCYIRPLVYRGYAEMGLNPLGCPVDVMVAVWEWGAYLGAESIEQGIDACVSSWRRPAMDTIPTLAKSGGNYLNAQLIKMEALQNGYAEGISLDVNGSVSEGSGENIFVIRDGMIYTPPMSTGLLPGITRASVMTLAGELGIPVKEMEIPREMLYIADEIFLTGTAAELTPVRSVDRIAVGYGIAGPLTRKLQQAFFAIINDGTDSHGWLTLL